MSFREFKQEYLEKEKPVAWSSFAVFLGLIGLLSVGLAASIISALQLSGININTTATVVLLAFAGIFLLVSVVGLVLAIVAILLID